MSAPCPRAAVLPTEVERLRVEATRGLVAGERSELGQYFTPWPTATFMASLFDAFARPIRLLDAGAGVGSLTAAAVSDAIGRTNRPIEIDVVGYETDPSLVSGLTRTLALCKSGCERHGVQFTGAVVPADFVAAAAAMIEERRLGGNPPSFTHAILNPPYCKLNSHSSSRRHLRRVGIETSNLYAAFVALAVALLTPGGELVAITPRSFCNGPYFQPFREYLLRNASLRHLHVFESRTAAFADDGVLQETVIVHVIKGAPPGNVIVSTSPGPDQANRLARKVSYEQVVRRADPRWFIRVVTSELGDVLADDHAALPCTLRDLRIAVSTGKVVDFRVRENLRMEPGRQTQPLIYPTHFCEGIVRWPKPGKRPNALADGRATAALWMPRGTYVLAKRCTSKEERRRIVAAIFNPEVVPAEKVGFENHLNVFHANGAGLDRSLALGLAAFLNSTFVDAVFRQWSGHTQVNATDLRCLRYPSDRTLRRLGECAPVGSSQAALDAVVASVVGVARASRRT